MMRSRALPALFVAATLSISACGGSDDSSGDSDAVEADSEPTESGSEPTDSPEASEADGAAAGIRVVAPETAAATIANPPDGLVILDVRTEEEFREARIEGAVMLDFYREDFAEALAAEFDPDVPYVLYCRSGNRSSGARAIMEQLGFTDVEDVDGGIVGWLNAGLPIVSG